MSAWTVTIHPLAEPELLALPADMRASFLHIAELLETFGPQKVGMPLVRPVEGKLWEMRMRGRGGIARAAYAAVHGRTLRVLHVFVKKTEKTPRAAALSPVSRPSARLRSTSKSSTTEFESRPDSAICRPPLSVSNTMQFRWPLEPVGLYDLQPTSAGLPMVYMPSKRGNGCLLADAVQDAAKAGNVIRPVKQPTD